MNLASLIDTIDGNEHITIIHCNNRKELYKGQKVYINSIDMNANVTAIYTKEGKIVIEICN